MRITIDKCVVEFPERGDFSGDSIGRQDFERARVTAETTVQALTIVHGYGGPSPASASAPPATIKHLAELGRDVLRLYEQNLGVQNLGEWITVCVDRFKKGGPT